MPNKKLIEVISIVATLASLTVMLLSVWHWPPGTDRSLHKAIGAALAKQALRLLGPGGKIIVITRDTEVFPQPAVDVLLASFEREVRHGNATIATIQRLQVDPLRPVEVPPGDFMELIRRTPSNNVIVSFLGPPLFTTEEAKRLSAAKPKVVAFCSGGMANQLDLSKLFTEGLLHAALVSRPIKSDGSVAPPQTFDQLYMPVTPQDRTLPQDASTTPL